MTWIGALLIAWAGVYTFVAGYYGLMQLLRSRPEHGRFAAFCASYAVFSIATAFTVEAPSPAASHGWQVLQYAALLPTIGFFVDLCFLLVDEARPRLSRALWSWLGVGWVALLAGLFFDPAFADPQYDWGVGGPGRRAVAALRPLGAVVVAVGIGASAFALYRVAAGAQGRRDLRITALATIAPIAGGAYDLVARFTDLPPLLLASHLGLVPVLGVSYVLVGRFTRVDAELDDRRSQLAEAYESLREAQEELVRKEQLAAVGELSAVIAHELRNPLAIIKNAVSGLRREELSPEDAETLLAILDDEGDRLNRLVSDLLAYAKPISPEPGEVDLRGLVMRAVELAAGGRRGMEWIEIELDLDRPVATVEGDATLLRHALLNIVDNALQAMPSGGTLTVSCRDTEMDDGRRCVAVDFHDTGEGMDTLVRSRARDPFFTTREQGTGLGLAIVDRVARAHGGRVEIESRHGRGTTVSLLVPVERSSMAPPSS